MKTPLPRLAAVMTPFPYSISPAATRADAERMIAEHDFHHLPVTDGDIVVGVVHSEDLATSNADIVGDIARPGPYVVDMETPLAEVLNHMASHHVDATVVLRHGKLAGVFTTTDACRGFADLLETLSPTPGDDLVA